MRRNCRVRARGRGRLGGFGIVLVVLSVAAGFSGCGTAAEPPRNSAEPPQVAGYVININTATADELESLPKIGPKTALAIIEFREKNGPFRRIEHLMLVDGISETRFRVLRGRITVGPPVRSAR